MAATHFQHQGFQTRPAHLWAPNRFPLTFCGSTDWLEEELLSAALVTLLDKKPLQRMKRDVKYYYEPVGTVVFVHI